MKIIGLTGGVASGKSTVAQKVVDLTNGFHINTDKLAHDAYARGTVLYDQIVNSFGEGILDDREEIDRRKLGGIVFKDVKKMQLLNGLVWPVVKDEISLEVLDILRGRVREYVGQPLTSLPINIIIESALSVDHPFVTEKWLVTAPKYIALKRLKVRNNLSTEEALVRWQTQQNYMTVTTKFDVTIKNEGSYEDLEKVVAGLMDGR